MRRESDEETEREKLVRNQPQQPQASLGQAQGAPKIQQEQNKQPIIHERDGKQENDQQSETSSTSQNSSSNEQLNKQGFEIMGRQNSTTNQTLVVKLESDSVLWHKGTLLFSSKAIKERGEIDDVFRGLLESVNLWTGPPRMLQNVSNQMAYYTISKEDPYNGKILVLSENVYKQKFYINLNHLLTINYDSSQYTLRPHPDVKYLKMIHATSVALPLFVTLQSSKDSAIIQKSLAEDECMYLPNARILAMSQNIKYKWEENHRLAKFTGPGFIFFQPRSQQGDLFPSHNRQFLLANIGILTVIIALYIIQYMFLH